MIYIFKMKAKMKSKLIRFDILLSTRVLETLWFFSYPGFFSYPRFTFTSNNTEIDLRM